MPNVRLNLIKTSNLFCVFVNFRSVCKDCRPIGRASVSEAVDPEFDFGSGKIGIHIFLFVTKRKRYVNITPASLLVVPSEKTLNGITPCLIEKW